MGRFGTTIIGPVLRALHLDPYGNLASDNTAARLRKALSPVYLARKLSLLLYERRHPDQPWLTRQAIAALDAWLTPQHVAFEWGSGGGTLWLARRVRSLASVEHNDRWAATVRARLAAAGIGNVEYHLVAEDAYTGVIEAYPDASFDMILVDGLFRDVALRASMRKLRPGGRLVFDNVNWYLPSTSRTPHSRSVADGPESPIFAEAWATLQHWPTDWTTNGVNDTAIFVRPAD